MQMKGDAAAADCRSQNSLHCRRIDMDNNKLAELLFPAIDKTPEDYETIFPKRDLPEGAMVTRLGPSPVSYTHLDVYKRQVLNPPEYQYLPFAPLKMLERSILLFLQKK